MYVYISALARLKGRNSRWKEVNVIDSTLHTLYEEYKNVWLTLTHSSLNECNDGDTVYLSLDLNLLRSRYMSSPLTVRELLEDPSGQSLPTVTGRLKVVGQTVRYSDAWRCNYDIQIVKPGVHPDAQLPASEKTDLLIRREDIDYQYFYEHCLVTVNGFIHQTSHSSYGVYVTGGAVSGRLANRTQVGLISFDQIGKITPVPITDSMLYKPSDESLLKHAAYINLDRDLTGKTVLLVLGGYLHVLDRTYQQVGDSQFKIDFNNYPLPQRLFESRRYMDLSQLELPSTDRNLSAVALEDLYSESSLRAYLKLSQSFFVLVDTPDLYQVKHQLEKALLPGRWIAHTPPHYPLLKGNGKLEDYWYTLEEDRYVIACDDNFEINYNFETTAWRETPVIDETKSTTRPYSYSRGYFLEIGQETLEAA